MIAVVIVVVIVLVVLAVAGKAAWQAPAPDEALIISGLGAKAHNRDTAQALGFKIVKGGGTLVLPGFQTARRLSLAPHTVALDLAAPGVRVRGEVTYRVGDDHAAIANAARRFLNQQELMGEVVQKIFADRLRAARGDFTAEGGDRLQVAAARKLGQLGLVVDSVRIHDVTREKPGSGPAS